MGIYSAYLMCGEEPSWELSQDSMQSVTADVTGNDNFGIAFENTAQMSLVHSCLSTDTYDFVFTWLYTRGQWTITLWLNLDYSITQARTWCSIPHNVAFILSHIICLTLSRNFHTTNRLLKWNASSLATPCSAWSWKYYQPEVRCHTIELIVISDFGWNQSYLLSCRRSPWWSWSPKQSQQR